MNKKLLVTVKSVVAAIICLKNRRLWCLMVGFLLVSVETRGDVDYGAAAVNSMGATAGTKMGGEDNYNYFALTNHPGPSGVPLGGIGVGCFDYAPNGQFTRICINNWHATDPAPVISEVPGTFLAVWHDGQARLLQLGKDFAGMPAAHHTVYRGLFPTANCEVDDSAIVRAWSGLTPHNLKDSSLPLAWIEVEVHNSGKLPQQVAVAFSWQDVIARGIMDVPDTNLLRAGGSTVWGKEREFEKASKAGRSTWQSLPRVATQAEPFSVEGLVGVRQFSVPLQPVLKTYQNYNNEVVLLAENSVGAEISVLPAYPIKDATSVWSSFRKDGHFAEAAGVMPLFEPSGRSEMASAVAVRVTLKPNEHRVMRFAVCWFQPELKVDRVNGDPVTYFGGADYGRFYHNYFSSVSDLIRYAASEREHILRETMAWQEPVLSSSYPDWLKFKIINSAYTMYASSILNKAGDFTVLEGAMGGLAGTMDQQLSAHPFFFKFFPELERANLELFGLNPGPKGQILHFDGHYYFGLNSRAGQTPVPEGCMLDNTGGWLVQLAAYWQQGDDVEWIKSFGNEIHSSLAYLRDQIKSKHYQIVTGLTTYDDFWHPEIYAYNASTYPAFLQSGAVLLDAVGDAAGAAACRQQAETSARDAVRALWNGRFFAYGANLDGSRRRDDIMFSGQLAGQFLSRYLGLGDTFAMGIVKTSIVAQLQSNIAHSPDYYAPKVWNIAKKMAMYDPNRKSDRNSDSTCWPFYLETYTAMSAIQAGYVEDGLDIMRHIQLVNLRNGWVWTQNLWRPGELTYMTAPATWFITDVLAGASLDRGKRMLTLGPIFVGVENKIALPLYYPGFWAVVRGDRSTKTLKLEILRTFGSSEIIIDKIRALPVGVSAQEAIQCAIPQFRVKAGAVLDLTTNWEALTAAKLQKAILGNGTNDGTPNLTDLEPAASEASLTNRAPGFAINIHCGNCEPRYGQAAAGLGGMIWNCVAVGPGRSETSDLVDGNGSPVSLQIVFNGFSGCFADGTSGQNVAGFEDLMGNYAFLNHAAGQNEAEITVTGLDTAKNYDVYLYGLGNFPDQTVNFHINGTVKRTSWPISTPATSLQEDRHYVVFHAIAAASGVLKIKVVNSDPANHQFAAVNGLQIVESR